MTVTPRPLWSSLCPGGDGWVPHCVPGVAAGSLTVSLGVGAGSLTVSWGRATLCLPWRGLGAVTTAQLDTSLT